MNPTFLDQLSINRRTNMGSFKPMLRFMDVNGNEISLDVFYITTVYPDADHDGKKTSRIVTVNQSFRVLDPDRTVMKQIEETKRGN